MIDDVLQVMYDFLEYRSSHDGFPFFKTLTSLHLECCSENNLKLVSNYD